MKQPKALFLLFFVEMWECFSYYGMRVLLVLYMIEKMHLSDFQAFGIYGLYTALVELGAVAGGYFADKIFGLRPSIFLGGILITLGHLSLTFEQGPLWFFLALSLVITGSCLFKSNIKALLGQFYETNDPRRESGFTLFYTGINVGGFLATLTCGVIGQTYGWHMGFGLAALGMSLGMITLLLCKRTLGNKGDAPIGSSYSKKFLYVGGACIIPIVLMLALSHPTAVMPFMPLAGLALLIPLGVKLKNQPLETRKKIYFLLSLVFLIFIYFSFEELMGSVLMVFCERHVNRNIGSLNIPSSLLMGINPFTIILCGTILAKIRKFKIGGGTTHHLQKSCAFAFLFLGLAFLILASGSWMVPILGSAPLIFVAIPFFLIAFGELFLAPPIFSFCSQVAPLEMKGLLMAIVVMGFSYASLMSGTLGQLVAQGSPLQERGFYTLLFMIAGVVASLVSIGLMAFSLRKKRRESFKEIDF